MDHNKLFVSEGAIEKMGMSYFKDMEYDDSFEDIDTLKERIQYFAK